MPPTKGLFENMARIDREWMPEIRRLVAVEEGSGKLIVRLTSLEALDAYIPGATDGVPS